MSLTTSQLESSVTPSTAQPASEPVATTKPDLHSKLLTPAMQQYVHQKKRVGDAILLFRMGDFYETFYDDAVLCSKVLGIALTTRDRNSPTPVPLAGIPYHALDVYLAKLVKAGYRVAISEQLEDPKVAKGVLKRDVVRIVTAGTLTEEKLLAGGDDNILVAICIKGEKCGIALAELAGGRFEVMETSAASALDELVRIKPAELLVSDEVGGEPRKLGLRLQEVCATSMTLRSPAEFDAYSCERGLLDHFGTSTLRGFGFDEMSIGLCAAGVVIRYLVETQRTALTHIRAIRRHEAADFLQIDHNTWRALEIDRTLRSGAVEGTLLHAIDRTVHPHGGRMLRDWLRRPLIDSKPIELRQQAIEELVSDELLRSRARVVLKDLADVERIAARVALNRCTPRDLSSLGLTLRRLPELIGEIEGAKSLLLQDIASKLGGCNQVAELLGRAFRESPPNGLRDGGFIADDFHVELDRLRRIGCDGQEWLADYQRREVQRTGISTLKVGYNRVFGYYIEITNSAKDRAPAEYIRKQTVKNAERFITDDLKNHEHEVLTAVDRANELEFKLFEEIRATVAFEVPKLLRCAEAVATLDCLAGLAEIAVLRRYVRPEIADDVRLEIEGGRHPVLDQTLGDAFIPNDLTLDDDSRVHVITGPNMAGKSTFIRQAALLTLLAQTGSFVPAKKMTWGAADRIFARVGSADEIARGQSTFMTEMIDAANILHHATKKSLVVLDELGRGTSTFDGLSLAWAITENLAKEIQCRTLVATHYHELTELAGVVPNVRNFNVAVLEHRAGQGQGEGVVFLHSIVPGGANKSYGIHVAKLAGVPGSVIERSRNVMEELQKGLEIKSRGARSAAKVKPDQFALFSDPAEELYAELKALENGGLTGDQALSILQNWKDKFAR